MSDAEVKHLYLVRYMRPEYDEFDLIETVGNLAQIHGDAGPGHRFYDPATQVSIDLDTVQTVYRVETEEEAREIANRFGKNPRRRGVEIRE